MGSGSFSLEVGGPRMAPGRTDGVPDPDWCARVIKHLEEQQIDKLIKESTQHQMLKAGNVGGELLNWIAMLGAIGNRKPNTSRRRCRTATPTACGGGTRAHAPTESTISAHSRASGNQKESADIAVDPLGPRFRGDERSSPVDLSEACSKPSVRRDLPLNFHPAATRASAVDTPFGAV